MVVAGAGYVGPDNGTGWCVFDSHGRPFEGSLPSKQAAVARAVFLSATRQLT
jgi:hypothetical protein